MTHPASEHNRFMRAALALASQAAGETSPNPMVGALLVKRGEIIGRGWHRRAGGPHAEVEAITDARRRGWDPQDATLYVTLEPCCTHGRTPPCTDAILAAGIKQVVVAATDPNPRHCGKGLHILRAAGVGIIGDIEAQRAERLNEAFNHWIVRRIPFVTLKAAMSLDGKIATKTGQSKWITEEKARAHGMRLRQTADAILVGINTVLTDDPSLTVRTRRRRQSITLACKRRFVVDAAAQTPLTARLLNDEFAKLTTIVVSATAPKRRIAQLSRKANVMVAPLRNGRIDLRWLLRKLGGQDITSLLIEGGGEVNASFIEQGLVQRVAFFYAPKIIGGWTARKAVAGAGIAEVRRKMLLRDVEWLRLGEDLMLTARVA